MITDRELQLIQAFVVPAKRTRYETFLTSPKRREKFLGQLYHFGDFDLRLWSTVKVKARTRLILIAGTFYLVVWAGTQIWGEPRVQASAVSRYLPSASPTTPSLQS